MLINRQMIETKPVFALILQLSDLLDLKFQVRLIKLMMMTNQLFYILGPSFLCISMLVLIFLPSFSPPLNFFAEVVHTSLILIFLCSVQIPFLRISDEGVLSFCPSSSLKLKSSKFVSHKSFVTLGHTIVIHEIEDHVDMG